MYTYLSNLPEKFPLHLLVFSERGRRAHEHSSRAAAAAAATAAATATTTATTIAATAAPAIRIRRCRRRLAHGARSPPGPAPANTVHGSTPTTPTSTLAATAAAPAAPAQHRCSLESCLCSPLSKGGGINAPGRSSPASYITSEPDRSRPAASAPVAPPEADGETELPPPKAVGVLRGLLSFVLLLLLLLLLGGFRLPGRGGDGGPGGSGASGTAGAVMAAAGDSAGSGAVAQRPVCAHDAELAVRSKRGYGAHQLPVVGGRLVLLAVGFSAQLWLGFR